FLGNIDAAHALHALFAFFLLLQQLALAADVAAVALGDHILTNGRDILASDDARADGGLEGDLEHLAGNQFAHASAEGTPAREGGVAVTNEAERVHGLTGDQEIHLDQVRDPVAR